MVGSRWLRDGGKEVEDDRSTGGVNLRDGSDGEKLTP